MEIQDKSRICGGCGAQFIPTRGNKQTRCSVKCRQLHPDEVSRKRTRNSARSNLRATQMPLFCAVDGEGYTRPDGQHIYTMLSVGKETLTHPEGEQLSTHAIFSFLWRHFADAAEAGEVYTYVGYFLGYDFTQWFRGLPEYVARQLLHKDEIAKRVNKMSPVPWSVRWGPWEFDIMGGKRFKLRMRGHNRWMYINDAGSYFQASFVTAINPKAWAEPVCTQQQFEIIRAGKLKRADILTREQWLQRALDTSEYNQMENRILPLMMDRLAHGLAKENVKLDVDQWYGPGQAAQKWLANLGSIASVDVQAATPRVVLDAARDSYYGGWFEAFAHGHLRGTTYEYDINSAYPYAMTQLPCLHHSTWVADSRQARYALILADVHGDNKILGAMQCRRDNGTIARPARVIGWYWEHELAMAMRAGAIRGYMDVGEVSRYRLKECKNPGCTPLAEAIPQIYQRRLEAGKDTAYGKALKILYNSTYGKYAQSVGTPRFSNPIYASLITSICRTMILEAIATHPTREKSLAMVATDGVYFREPHPLLEVHPTKLGAWGAVEKQNLTIFLPGVYWDDAKRLGLDQKALKSRGISATDLADHISRIDDHFRDFNGRGEWPSLEIPLRFNMVTAKLAIMRGNWPSAGTFNADDKRIINSDPGSKRAISQGLVKDPRGDLRYPPYPRATDDTWSCPYTGRFGMELEEKRLHNGETADGPGNYILPELLGMK